MNYTEILKRAGRITWHHRALWLFGVLLVLFGGGSPSPAPNGNNGGQNVQYRFGYTDIEGLILPTVNWAAVIAIMLAVLALILVLIVISIIVRYLSIGALIGMVDEVEREESTSIRSGFRTGWARFLRLFAVELLLGIPAAIIFIGLLLIVLVPLPLVIVGARGDAAILIVLGVIGMIGLFLLWLLLAIVAGVVLHVLLQFAYRRCVLAGEGVFGSIREGYHMVRRNIRDAGLTWLLLLGIRLVLSVVLVPVGLLLLAVPVSMGAAAWAISRTLVGALVAGLPLLVVAIAGLVFVEALWLIFESAVWTLVYREIPAPPEPEAESA
jgi:hypothetical protein